MSLWLTFVLIFFALTFVLMLWVFIKTRTSKKFSSGDQKYIKSHWSRIVNGDDLKHSVMDADKLLDYALKAKGFEGSLGEKLKLAGPRFSDLNGIWSAHKLRNRIAHEMGDISKGDGERALKSFRRALHDLGAKL
ncbi:MAG: hypothetical protein O3B47_04935 [bacterium]|nr:hypothetical protein [bacterium]